MFFFKTSILLGPPVYPIPYPYMIYGIDIRNGSDQISACLKDVFPLCALALVSVSFWPKSPYRALGLTPSAITRTRHMQHYKDPPHAALQQATSDETRGHMLHRCDIIGGGPAHNNHI